MTNPKENPFLEGYVRPQPAEPEDVREAFKDEKREPSTCFGNALAEG